MIITTNCWLNQGWLDEKLKWNPRQYGGIKFIHIPAEKIWKPDIMLVNNADSWAKISSISTNAIVKHDGNVTWLSTVIFKSSCSIHVRYFPFDEQSCDMIFASWSFDGFFLDLNLNSEEGDITNYIKNGEWHLVKLAATKIKKMYSCCEEPYPEIHYKLTIRRRPLYYVFNLVFPCLLITLVAFLGFYLPPDSSEKVSMGITTLLSLTVFLMLVAESMPPTSDQLPLLGIYYAVTIGIVSFSTAMAVITLNVYNKGSKGRKIPKLVKIIFFNYIAKILRTELSKEIKRKKKLEQMNAENEYRQANQPSFKGDDLVTPNTTAAVVSMKAEATAAKEPKIADKKEGQKVKRKPSKTNKKSLQSFKLPNNLDEEREDDGDYESPKLGYNEKQERRQITGNDKTSSEETSASLATISPTTSSTTTSTPSTVKVRHGSILKSNKSANAKSDHDEYDERGDECSMNEINENNFLLFGFDENRSNSFVKTVNFDKMLVRPTSILRSSDTQAALRAMNSCTNKQMASMDFSKIDFSPTLPPQMPISPTVSSNMHCMCECQSSQLNSCCSTSENKTIVQSLSKSEKLVAHLNEMAASRRVSLTANNSSKRTTDLFAFNQDFLNELELILKRQFDPLITHITRNLQESDERRREKEHLEDIQDEWSDLALVCDHFLCYFFPLLTVFVCFLIFFNSPHVFYPW
jgi:nicotinic acetylcholine receptor